LLECRSTTCKIAAQQSNNQLNTLLGTNIWQKESIVERGIKSNFQAKANSITFDKFCWHVT
jgi:hypothetical protein